MNFKQSIPIVAVAMMTACASGSKEQGIGIKPENMDTKAQPGTDFYRYACGGWIDSNPLRPEYSRFGSFDVVSENNKQQIKDLILGLAAEKQEAGSVGQKIGDLYSMMMDSARMDRDGIRPLADDLAAIEALDERDDVLRMMVENSVKGAGELWGSGIGADMMNASQNMVEIGQSGLSMGEKEYYVSDDSAYVKIREAFKRHVAAMFRLAGDDEATAARRVNSVMDVETRMAQASKNNVELRDPASNYHKMTYNAFKAEYAGYDWDRYFHINHIDGLKELSVGQPEAVHAALTILRDTDLRTLKDWMVWNLLDANANYIGDKFYAEHFDFYNRTMTGQQQPQPRWKRAVGVVNGILGEAVGEMYVKKYFPAENKARMEELVKNLQEALAQRIDAQDWMSPETKKYAKEKLAAFYVKIGYPDKWDDYSRLTIDPAQNLYQTMTAVREWAVKKEVEEKYNKPVDREKWYMTPQTVNAYYNPTTNEICFPAGILQYPFFDMNADDAFNYGAIGVVIGHEMTHGFDDQGRQFDKDGNFRDWWAAGDGDKFKERAKVMSDFFSAITILPGLKGNGDLTLGENLADHGGLEVAYRAFCNAQEKAEKDGQQPLGTVQGFTPAQRFFLAYAGVWAQNITEAAIRDLTTRDSHSLGEWRVNGALPHIDAWYDAFGIKETDPLFIPKDKRVHIW